MAQLQVLVIVIEMSAIVFVIYAMSMQVFNYLPSRLPSTKVQKSGLLNIICRLILISSFCSIRVK